MKRKIKEEAPAKKQRIYISGPITGHTDYLEKFMAMATELRANGYEPINPALVNANLPSSTTWEEYMKMSFVMLDMADGIVMLPGWMNSNGARLELCKAIDDKKAILFA